MIRAAALLSSLLAASCSGVAWNTEVAGTEAARLSMAASVIPGQTTEKGLITRWGKPTQRIREGGQTEFIYRSMTNPPGWYFPQYGDSQSYVIVTFQYGLASAVRTSDGIDCRGTFPPRPPSYTLDRPSTVRLVGACAGPISAADAARKGPWATLWDRLNQNWGGPAPAAKPPGVEEDRYVGGSSDLK